MLGVLTTKTKTNEEKTHRVTQIHRILGVAPNVMCFLLNPSLYIRELSPSGHVFRLIHTISW